MYNSNTESLELILGVEVFWVTVQEHCVGYHKLVTRYNMEGQATTLPSLNTGRCYHACGKIVNSNGATVSQSWFMSD